MTADLLWSVWSVDSHGGLDGLSFGGGGSSGSNPEFKVILYKSRSELFDI